NRLQPDRIETGNTRRPQRSSLLILGVGVYNSAHSAASENPQDSRGEAHMYGTITRFRIKPGVRDEFIKAMDSFGDAVIPGWGADYYFQMDKDPNEFYLVAIFQDRETYMANADSA